MASWYRRLNAGVLELFVHAQPGAKRTEVAGLHGDALKVRIAAPALEDRANEALVAFFAEALGTSKRDVVLVSGERSREKRLRVSRATRPPECLLP